MEFSECSNVGTSFAWQTVGGKMPKYQDNFENFHRQHKVKQAKTIAGIIAGFVVFFGGLFWLMSASVPPTQDVDQGSTQSAPMPEELQPPPQEIVEQPAAPVETTTVTEAPAVVEAPVTPVEPAKTKKISKKLFKKIAKAKSKKKDNLVCIPPSRLKALEKQVAKASRR